MRRMNVVVYLVLALLVLPATTMAVEVGVRGYYWFPSLDGTVKVDEAGVLGTNIDFDQDLGIDDGEYPSVEVFLGGGKHHVSMVYTNVDYSGSKILARSIYFNGQQYALNSLVNASIEYDMFDFFYQYDLVDLENVLAGFSLGAVAHVKYLDGEVSLKATGIDEKEDFNLPIPMLGLNLHVGLLADILEVRVKGTGMTYSGNVMYELLGELSWTPFPFVDVHGGYKVFATDIDEDNVILDYDMSGPYVALTIGF